MDGAYSCNSDGFSGEVWFSRSGVGWVWRESELEKRPSMVEMVDEPTIFEE